MQPFLFKNRKIISNIFVLIFPVFLNAQLITPNGTFGDAVMTFATLILNIVLPALLSLAVLVFFWGVAKFLLQPGNKTEIENGKKYMLWGTIALFVLLSIRAIIGQLINLVGLNGFENTDPSSIWIRF